MKILEKIDTYLIEASPIEFDEIDVNAAKFIAKHIPHYNRQSYFEGVSGYVANLSNPGMPADYGIRLFKNDLKKIINDPTFRWADIKAIGF